MEKGKQTQSSGEIKWSVLPGEVEENILSRLPVKFLMRFRCVCKHWCNLVTNPHFIKLHLNRSTLIKEGTKVVRAYGDKLYAIDVEACRNIHCIKIKGQKKVKLETELFDDPSFDFNLKVLGSCNGLLCLYGLDCLHLLNPATKEHKELPYPKDVFPYAKGPTPTAVFGFGYNPRNDEYKVLMIQYFGSGESLHCDTVYVYTLGINSSWRSIGSMEYKIKETFHALVNGTLHWMASDTPGFTVVPISFDFGDEKFRKLSLPKSFCQEDTNYPMGLVELDGFLSLYHHKNESFDIWAMKDYGDEQSWTKVFSVTHPIFSQLGKWCYGGEWYCDNEQSWTRVFSVPHPVFSTDGKWFRPLIFLKKDEVLCENGYEFFIVKKKIRTLHMKSGLEASIAETYFESLVSLRVDCGMDLGNKKRKEEDWNWRRQVRKIIY